MTPYNTFLSSRPKGEIFVFFKDGCARRNLRTRCARNNKQCAGTGFKTLKQKPVIPAKAKIQPVCIGYLYLTQLTNFNTVKKFKTAHMKREGP